MKKINRLIIIFIALIVILSSCSNERNETNIGSQLVKSSQYSVQKHVPVYLLDAYALVSTVEKTHPAFALNDISDDYEREKQEFIASVSRDTTEEEFILLVRKYLTVLQDGHTGVRDYSDKRFLDVSCHANGNELFLINDDGSLSEERITHIGGVPVNRIFDTVQTWHVAENHSARDKNNSMWALNDEVLKLAGANIESHLAEVTIDNNGAAYKKNVEFVNKDIYEYYYYTYDIKSDIINDIFYIDMNTCDVNQNLEAQVEELKKAIREGFTKVIIDVRDNRGGDSEACIKLLKAMGMNPPSYGGYIRYSDLASKQRNVRSEGFMQYDPDKTKAKRNENIQLVVLTNEITYSSATMMAVFVQDGDLGTVIGTPSSNAPSSYGDILYYKLPASGIEVSISYKRWLRPDTDADQRILMPDIVTEYNEDILQRAIDYLNQ